MRGSRVPHKSVTAAAPTEYVFTLTDHRKATFVQLLRTAPSTQHCPAPPQWPNRVYRNRGTPFDGGMVGAPQVTPPHRLCARAWGARVDVGHAHVRMACALWCACDTVPLQRVRACCCVLVCTKRSCVRRSVCVTRVFPRPRGVLTRAGVIKDMFLKVAETTPAVALTKVLLSPGGVCGWGGGAPVEE